MTRLQDALAGVWDFVVGDDWRTALGVVIALGLTAIVSSGGGISAWWITPLAVVGLLALSLWRAGRDFRGGS